MPRANEMFRADSRMMVVFGALTSKPEQLTFEETLRFVKKVKLQLLFGNHPDLCEELEKFRPPVPTKQAANNIWPWVIVCAVPLVAVSLIPALGNPVLWFVQQTVGEKMAA
ncbi:uncharacterized protein [Zea mays]|uniref:uncharacterized protein isoform X4 n=1 Tax=Zea mays TaxID=4577 RepID=UPI0009A9A73B|nr:uncharacterized protein LOC100280234 isoform X4 [Zea mays]|eukprot:XP_020405275.1 uncharacterized protein LOC100280234 isoform X4 [Zea mays]